MFNRLLDNSVLLLCSSSAATDVNLRPTRRLMTSGWRRKIRQLPQSFLSSEGSKRFLMEEYLIVLGSLVIKGVNNAEVLMCSWSISPLLGESQGVPADQVISLGFSVATHFLISRCHWGALCSCSRSLWCNRVKTLPAQEPNVSLC